MAERVMSVYILTNRPGGTLYVGVTNDLLRRMHEHRTRQDPGSFASRHGLEVLVYCEQTTDVRSALQREKQLKSWNRSWKVRLIEKENPRWEDLWPSIVGDGP